MASNSHVLIHSRLGTTKYRQVGSTLFDLRPLGYFSLDLAHEYDPSISMDTTSKNPKP